MYKNQLLLVQQRRNLVKAKGRYSKEKATEYYLENKDAKGIDIKTCQKKKKTRLKSTKDKDISN